MAKSARLLGAEEADVFEYIQSRTTAGPSVDNAHVGTKISSGELATGTSGSGTFGRLTRKVSKRSIQPIANLPGTTGTPTTFTLSHPDGGGITALGSSVNTSQTHSAPYHTQPNQSSTTQHPTLPRDSGKSKGYQRQLDRFEALVDLSETRNAPMAALGSMASRAGGGMPVVRGGSGPCSVSAAGGVHAGARRGAKMPIGGAKGGIQGDGVRMGTEGQKYKRQSKSVHPLFATVSPGDGAFSGHSPLPTSFVSAGQNAIAFNKTNRVKRSTSDPVSPDMPYTTLPSRHAKHSSQHGAPHTNDTRGAGAHARPSLPAPPRGRAVLDSLHPIIPPTTPQRYATSSKPLATPSAGRTGTTNTNTTTHNPIPSCSPNTRRLKAEKEWRARVQALSAGVRSGRERASPYPQRSSVILLNEDSFAGPALDGDIRIGVGIGAEAGRAGVYKGPLPPRAPRRRQTPSPTPAVGVAGMPAGLGAGGGGASKVSSTPSALSD